MYLDQWNQEVYALNLKNPQCFPRSLRVYESGRSNAWASSSSSTSSSSCPAFQRLFRSFQGFSGIKFSPVSPMIHQSNNPPIQFSASAAKGGQWLLTAGITSRQPAPYRTLDFRRK